MAKIVHFGLTAAAAFILATCSGNVLANNANADDTPERTASTGPTKVALITLEKSAYEAWKSKDAKFWVTFLSDKFVGWGSFGKLDKTSATKEYTGTDCEIKSYALSDEQLSSLDKDAALITIRRLLTAHVADNSSRPIVGRQRYMFATMVNGSEPSTPELRLSIQKRLWRSRLTGSGRLMRTMLNRPIEMPAPTPCSRPKRLSGKHGEHTMLRSLRT